MRYLFFIIALLVLQSCAQKVDCVNEYVSAGIFFKGFDSVSLARVIIKQYAPNGDHIKPRITAVYKNDSSDLIDRREYELAHGYSHWPFSVSLLPPYDWTIEVPGTGKVYHISGITGTSETQMVPFMSGYSSSDICYDVVTSYYLDSVYYSTGFTVKAPGQVADALDIVLER